MATVFLARCGFGAIQPDDDIAELKRFRLDSKFDRGCVLASHPPLLSGVLKAIERFRETTEGEGSP